MVIPELNLEDLRPGDLARSFSSGAPAAVVRCPQAVSDLWQRLVEDEDEQLPWEAPLLDLARNHHGCEDITASLGDLFYFQPGLHSYIARKIELRAVDDGIAVEPPRFHQGHAHFAPKPAAVARAWDLTSRIMAALTPEGIKLNFKVAVQRLKYQDSSDDYERLVTMANNSLARWGRLGARLDRARLEAAGPLKRKGWSDLFGMIAMVPGLGTVARRLNAPLERRDPQRRLAHSQRVFEGAHLDQRYFSALCGAREDVRTQALIDGAWRDLPIGLDSFVVIPGNLAHKRFGFTPTLHRVIHVEDASTSARGPRTRNVTLLLGAV